MNGWFNEQYRHSLAARGIRTAYYAKRTNKKMGQYAEYVRMGETIRKLQKERDRLKHVVDVAKDEKRKLGMKYGYDSERVQDVEKLRKVAADERREKKLELKELRREYAKMQRASQVGAGNVVPLHRGEEGSEHLRLIGEPGIVKEGPNEYVFSPEIRKRAIREGRREERKKLRKALENEREAKKNMKLYEDILTTEPKYAKRVAYDPQTGTYRKRRVPIAGYGLAKRKAKASARTTVALEEREEKEAEKLRVAEIAARRARRDLDKIERVEKESKRMEKRFAKREREFVPREYAPKKRKVKRHKLTYVEREERGEDMGLLEAI